MTKKRNLIFLNLLLIGTAVGLFYHLNSQRTQFWVQHNLAALNPKAEGGSTVRNPITKSVPMTSYVNIVDNNLFSSDRNNLIPPDPEATVVNRPKPILSGILGFGGQQIALMLPANANDSRQYKQLKIGETLDGYTLVKFLDQKVVMSVGGKEMEIPLSEPTKLVAREQPASTAGQAAAGSANPRQVTTVDQGGASARTASAAPLQNPSAYRGDQEGTVKNGKVLKSIPSPFGAFHIYVEEGKK